MATLGEDPRITFETADADTWLDTYSDPRLSLAYVDCRPGMFHRLIDLPEPGGRYVA
ncbi:hypothetical protein AB0D12_32215 [Streptomyces sp. NPDC048479]|uniref:hypothetical protein n=1 Tax=Streptomyces sp. NPDC048479 TaxID=3154725 RepID=UPI0034340EDF